MSLTAGGDAGGLLPRQPAATHPRPAGIADPAEDGSLVLVSHVSINGLHLDAEDDMVHQPRPHLGRETLLDATTRTRRSALTTRREMNHGEKTVSRTSPGTFWNIRSCETRGRSKRMAVDAIQRSASWSRCPRAWPMRRHSALSRA